MADTHSSDDELPGGSQQRVVQHPSRPAVAAAFWAGGARQQRPFHSLPQPLIRVLREQLDSGELAAAAGVCRAWATQLARDVVHCVMCLPGSYEHLLCRLEQLAARFPNIHSWRLWLPTGADWGAVDELRLLWLLSRYKAEELELDGRLSCNSSQQRLPVVDREVMPWMASLRALRSLRLSRCVLASPAALAYLSFLPALRSLLFGHRAEDWLAQGVGPLLPHLARLGQVEEVEIHVEGAAALPAHLPEQAGALFGSCGRLRRLTVVLGASAAAVEPMEAATFERAARAEGWGPPAAAAAAAAAAAGRWLHVLDPLAAKVALAAGWDLSEYGEGGGSSDGSDADDSGSNGGGGSGGRRRRPGGYGLGGIQPAPAQQHGAPPPDADGPGAPGASGAGGGAARRRRGGGGGGSGELFGRMPKRLRLLREQLHHYRHGALSDSPPARRSDGRAYARRARQAGGGGEPLTSHSSGAEDSPRAEMPALGAGHGAAPSSGGPCGSGGASGPQQERAGGGWQAARRGGRWRKWRGRSPPPRLDTGEASDQEPARAPRPGNAPVPAPASGGCASAGGGGAGQGHPAVPGGGTAGGPAGAPVAALPLELLGRELGQGCGTMAAAAAGAAAASPPRMSPLQLLDRELGSLGQQRPQEQQPQQPAGAEPVAADAAAAAGAAAMPASATGAGAAAASGGGGGGQHAPAAAAANATTRQRAPFAAPGWPEPPEEAAGGLWRGHRRWREARLRSELAMAMRDSDQGGQHESSSRRQMTGRARQWPDRPPARSAVAASAAAPPAQAQAQAPAPATGGAAAASSAAHINGAVDLLVAAAAAMAAAGAAGAAPPPPQAPPPLPPPPPPDAAPVAPAAAVAAAAPAAALVEPLRLSRFNRVAVRPDGVVVSGLRLVGLSGPSGLQQRLQQQLAASPAVALRRLDLGFSSAGGCLAVQGSGRFMQQLLREMPLLRELRLSGVTHCEAAGDGSAPHLWRSIGQLRGLTRLSFSYCRAAHANVSLAPPPPPEGSAAAVAAAERGPPQQEPPPAPWTMRLQLDRRLMKVLERQLRCLRALEFSGDVSAEPIAAAAAAGPGARPALSLLPRLSGLVELRLEQSTLPMPRRPGAYLQLDMAWLPPALTRLRLHGLALALRGAQAVGDADGAGHAALLLARRLANKPDAWWEAAAAADPKGKAPARPQQQPPPLAGRSGGVASTAAAAAAAAAAAPVLLPALAELSLSECSGAQAAIVGCLAHSTGLRKLELVARSDPPLRLASIAWTWPRLNEVQLTERGYGPRGARGRAPAPGTVAAAPGGGASAASGGGGGDGVAVLEAAPGGHLPDLLDPHVTPELAAAWLWGCRLPAGAAGGGGDGSGACSSRSCGGAAGRLLAEVRSRRPGGGGGGGGGGRGAACCTWADPQGLAQFASGLANLSKLVLRVPHGPAEPGCAGRFGPAHLLALRAAGQLRELVAELPAQCGFAATASGIRSLTALSGLRLLELQCVVERPLLEEAAAAAAAAAAAVAAAAAGGALGGGLHLVLQQQQQQQQQGAGHPGIPGLGGGAMGGALAAQLAAAQQAGLGAGGLAGANAAAAMLLAHALDAVGPGPWGPEGVPPAMPLPGMPQVPPAGALGQGLAALLGAVLGGPAAAGAAPAAPAPPPPPPAAAAAAAAAANAAGAGAQQPPFNNDDYFDATETDDGEDLAASEAAARAALAADVAADAAADAAEAAAAANAAGASGEAAAAAAAVAAADAAEVAAVAAAAGGAPQGPAVAAPAPPPVAPLLPQAQAVAAAAPPPPPGKRRRRHRPADLLEDMRRRMPNTSVFLQITRAL